MINRIVQFSLRQPLFIWLALTPARRAIQSRP